MVFASFEPQGPAGSLTNCFKVVSFIPLERKSDETDASSVRKLKKAWCSLLISLNFSVNSLIDLHPPN